MGIRGGGAEGRVRGGEGKTEEGKGLEGPPCVSSNVS